MKQNFKVIKGELEKQICNFEKEYGDLRTQILNENEPYLHTMLVKEDFDQIFQNDSEFEKADLLDYMGYERIISCRKNNKT